MSSHELSKLSLHVGPKASLKTAQKNKTAKSGHSLQVSSDHLK